MYKKQVNPQVIYASVDNDALEVRTGEDSSICNAVASLTLQVNPLKVFNKEDGYSLCVNPNGTLILAPLAMYRVGSLRLRRATKKAVE